MHMTSTDALQPGAKLAKPIYSSNGSVLLAAGKELSQSMIQRLLDLNVTQVYIDDPRTSDLIIEDAISEPTRSRAVKVVYETFSQMIESRKWMRSIANPRLGREFRGVFEDILYDLQSKKQVMLQLTGIYTTDNYLYSHSVNVGIYSAALGMALGLKRDALIDLGIGALLHDIGKTMVPMEILMKPGKLTDEEYALMKQHAFWGYEILKEHDDIPLISAHCALQHHERLDGSGYPRSLQGDGIHLYGQIVGIADVYDALTSNRVYRKAYLPHEALEILFASTGQFDGDLIRKFRDNVALYPLGLTVTLNSGETAVVVDINTKYPHRPILRVLKDAEGRDLQHPHEVDLSQDLTLMITDCEEIL
ncbi:HD-GYP domain-containing protein (c-di-GMP phosphodiesterase class II) [Tumebacillus sp. BK434]|uniref:HD-GYP domain-containing protein n=1 Tax=Tumebacillus sp. BK434 TaxID=2512169 RepID=UPI00104C1A42|nr:HD-GYP domain-containing protein [Tumebacillus sp. BK434]TCP55580.1 HD-GYP domain-containing protein (c-di-GMP phosphodiesterase class II) [Tumebacillus sp. BK434]